MCVSLPLSIRGSQISPDRRFSTNHSPGKVTIAHHFWKFIAALLPLDRIINNRNRKSKLRRDFSKTPLGIVAANNFRFQRRTCSFDDFAISWRTHCIFWSVRSSSSWSTSRSFTVWAEISAYLCFSSYLSRGMSSSVLFPQTPKIEGRRRTSQTLTGNYCSFEKRQMAVPLHFWASKDSGSPVCHLCNP